jgi:hypothetical protein
MLVTAGLGPPTEHALISLLALNGLRVSEAAGADGHKPYSHRTFIQQLEAWQRIIDLRDQAGQPVRVTGHQFRHTLVICTAFSA